MIRGLSLCDLRHTALLSKEKEFDNLSKTLKEIGDYDCELSEIE